MLRIVCFLALSIFWPSAFAHKASDSYLHVAIDKNTIQVQWDIALRDIDYAIGLDSNADGAITWAELRAAQKALNAYALPRLRIYNDNIECANPNTTELLVDQHTDGGYAVLRYTPTCSGDIAAITLDYQLLFDLDKQHRGLLKLTRSGEVQTTVFSPTHSRFDASIQADSWWRTLVTFVREGTFHIASGYDHILFLLTLLLPAVLRREDKAWHAVREFKPALSDIVKIVTAFTIAHSVTLSLAVMGVINLPSRWVETLIAVSVVIVALNNLYPLLTGKRWLVAFGFGLIHGLGFASVLSDVGLESGSLVISLIGFNLGVELGQLAIVLVCMPLAYALRSTWFYQKLVFRTGSVVVALLATVWAFQRAWAS